jgi:hypothetical protein
VKRSLLISVVFCLTIRLLVAEEKYALIIGISDYPKLHAETSIKYADRDAADFAAFIQTPQGGGFEPQNVHLITDALATRDRIYVEFLWLYRNVGPAAVVYVFFAGHGDRYRNRGYFLPFETAADNPESAGIPMTEFFDKVTKELAARQVVLFIDTCHSAAMSQGTRASISLPADVLQEWNTSNERGSKDGQNVTAFFSSMANEESYEDRELGGGHGLFTYYLLQGLKGAAKATTDGFITGASLVDYVHDEVVRRSEARFTARQDPIVSADFSGSLKLSYVGPPKADSDLEKGVLAVPPLRESAGTGRLLAIFAHNGPINQVSFSSDGSLIVTSSDDATARVWDATDGKLRITLRHAGPVLNALFSPSGLLLLTVRSGGKLCIWDVRTEKIISSFTVANAAINPYFQTTIM